MSDLKKIFPRLLTVVLFAVNVSILICRFSFSRPLTTALLFALNFFIIFGVIYFGTKGILAFGCCGILAILLRSLRISALTQPLRAGAEPAIFPAILLAVTSCIFYLYSSRAGRLTRRIEKELDNIEEEKNILSVELEHGRLENASLKQKVRRYAVLKDLSETLSSTLSLDKTLSLITSEALRIIGKSNACLLYLVDRQKQQLSLASTRLEGAQYEVRFKKGDMFDNWIFKQRTPFIVEDAKKDFRFNIQDVEANARNVRSLVSAPLISENKLLGILRLDNVSPRAYSADDLRLLDIISDLAAVAIENSLLYRESEKLAITDGLTGLFVHRYFQERFGEEISRSLWTDSQFAFLMLDIDDFKQYNDKYGHIAGDIVLKKVAGLITSSVHPGDIVARYGGEEFAVLLVEISKAEAQKVAQRLREKIEKKDFALRRERTRVRVSGGIASFPEDGKLKDELIRKADQALYRAKAEGKNRICMY